MSAIDATESRQGWQPIQTAPRDGTQILVMCEGGAAIAAWNPKQIGPGISGEIQNPGWVGYANGTQISDEGWDTGFGYTLGLHPTHWQHIPSHHEDLKLRSAGTR